MSRDDDSDCNCGERICGTEGPAGEERTHPPDDPRPTFASAESVRLHSGREPEVADANANEGSID